MLCEFYFNLKRVMKPFFAYGLHRAMLAAFGLWAAAGGPVAGS